MNPYTPGTFWWARHEYITGRRVQDEDGFKYDPESEDLALNTARWDTWLRFTVREFESGGWVLY